MATAVDADRLRQFIAGIDQIPTLPVVANHLLKMVDDPDVTVEGIAELLSSDQALSARVLRTVNSAYFGLSKEVASVQRAVILMGLNSIRSICLGISVMAVFRKGSKACQAAMESFWKHSLGTAFAARSLATRLRLEQPDEAFTAGLLHDIGRAVLLQYAPEDEIRAGKLAEDRHISVLEAELEELGFDHRHSGGWIASVWKLPRLLVDCILWHHEPRKKAWESGLTGQMVHVVALANEMANYKKLTFSMAAPDIDLMGTMEDLGLDPQDVMESMEGIESEVEDFYKAL